MWRSPCFWTDVFCYSDDACNKYHTFSDVKNEILKLQINLNNKKKIRMSIIIAISIDYSLFILSRFREEVIKMKRNSEIDFLEAMSNTIGSSGSVICTSGIILTLVFLCTMILPLSFLKASGLGSAIAVLSVLLANIFLSPSVLLLFPKFFSNCSEDIMCCGKTCGGVSEREELMFSDSESEGEEDTLVQSERIENEKKLIWRKVAVVTQKSPYNILFIILVIILVVPFAYFAFQFSTTSSISTLIPRTGHLQANYEKLIEEFGYAVFPYQILMVPNNGSSVMNDAFFKVSQEVIFGLANGLSNTSVSNFEGVTVLTFDGEHINITYSEIKGCLTNKSQELQSELCNAVDWAVNRFVNKTEKAMWVLFNPTFDPLGNFGSNWLISARNILKNLSEKTETKFYICGFNAESLDAHTAVFDYFPIEISVSMCIILLFVGFSFGSLLVPIRSVFSIILTLFFVYGFFSLVYQFGMLNFLHFAPLHGEKGSVIWIAPIVSFVIIAGIAVGKISLFYFKFKKQINK